ncbi:GIY-YIG nuclease family protein [Arenibacter sp. BSSL-BM3]|uniref:Excinuclease cho n=1 Tax=Arenibacter arenosicollis TaxID=2762274 RepID=A0ABR7QRE9_9FLAO|nr:GIY-YIG nuclease family protein [Arenibacter arenosicollis]MBC8769771.1 GIY-YIG nuclease family protein [Arenibacter arenosicollis]
MNHQQFDALPSRSGIYKFQDKEGVVIYIGKAKNIKKRVLSHFQSKAQKEIVLCNATFSIDYELAGNELIALLLESDLIQKHMPIYNTLQKKSHIAYYVCAAYNKMGVLQLTVEEMPRLHVSSELFYTKGAAKKKLEHLCEEFNLCPKYSGLQRKSGKCNHIKFPFCQGVCCEEENIGSYNERAKRAIASLKANADSYIVREKGRRSGEQSLILVLNGVYQGFKYIDSSQQICGIEDLLDLMNPRKHTFHVVQILNTYRKKNRSKIMYLEAETIMGL